MIKKFASKFVSDILPSIAATVIGAYVVTHYINKPATPPPATAAASVAEPGRPDAAAAPDRPATAAKGEKPEPPALAGLPEPAKAKADKPAPDKQAVDKSADKPDRRTHQPTPRDKAAKAVPPASEPAAMPEERRDANELARAAIERLRNSAEPAQAAAAAPQPPQLAPPLQPAVTVAAPVATYAVPPDFAPTGPGPSVEPAATTRFDAARRISPPAEIPAAGRPAGLRADAAPWDERPTVTGSVLSAAKSVFHAIVPR